MADRILALVMTGLGAAIIIGATQLDDLDFVDPLGHKTFPILVGIIAIVAAGLLLVEQYRERRTRTDRETETGTKSHPIAAACVLGWMLLMYFLLEIVGFAVVIAAFLFGLTAFFNRGQWLVNGVVSVSFSLAFYFVFTEVIGVPLARGLFAF